MEHTKLGLEEEIWGENVSNMYLTAEELELEITDEICALTKWGLWLENDPLH